jgi:hypothetical protein
MYIKNYNTFVNESYSDSPESFQRWFGESQTVEDGEPIIFYHGTAIEFSEFDVNKMRKGWLSKAFYFTKSEDEASDYGNIVLPVYLRIETPFIIENDIVNSDGTVTFVKSTKEQIYDAYPEAKSIEWGNVAAFLNSKGHDGIIQSDWVVVFHPNQIKSVENDGGWSITSNDIYS